MDAREAETRLVFAMLNEAAHALGEGVVRSPRDGDLGAIFGIGFPPFRGGALRYAATEEARNGSAADGPDAATDAPAGATARSAAPGPSEPAGHRTGEGTP